MSNITLMGHVKDDARFISPQQCVEDVMQNDLGKRGAFENGKKLLVVALDDTDDQFHLSWSQAGMDAVEIIALCESMKASMLKNMEVI